MNLMKRKLRRLFLKIKKIYYSSLKIKIVKGYYQIKLYSNWGDSTFNSYFFGFYEDEIKNIINQIKKPFVFFDIGANQGLYTILALQNKKCLNVFSFEPVKKTFFLLEKNIKANFSNQFMINKSNLLNYAISDSISKKLIFIPKYSSGKASLNTSREIQSSYKEIIDTVNFDWMNENIKIEENCDVFLKIDVEGHEEIVIKELLKTKFHKSIKYIIFEKHDDWKFIPYSGIENFLIQKGYDIERLQKNKNKKYDLMAIKK